MYITQLLCCVCVYAGDLSKMQYLTPYHAATYLLIIFALGHTFGGLYGTHDYTPAGNAVLTSMKSVYFDFYGSTCSFYDFYIGFGNIITIFLMLSAFLTWRLAEAKPSQQAALKPIAQALFLAYLALAGLCWMYLFTGPTLLSILIAGLMASECYTKY